MKPVVKTRELVRDLDSVAVECHRCGHKWRFFGKKLIFLGKYPIYAQCPQCRTSVKIKKGGKA